MTDASIRDTARLRQLLVEEDFRPDSYSLEGGDQDNTLCIEALRGGGWIVYYTERGSRFDMREFNEESAACEYFLHSMMRARGNRIGE
jgi:hypothetical protein